MRQTSIEAYLSVRNVTATQLAVLRTLAGSDGESTWGHCDSEIAVLYDGPHASESGIRSRRAELVAMGLVRDTGRKTRTPSGRSTMIWEATDQGLDYSKRNRKTKP